MPAHKFLIMLIIAPTIAVAAPTAAAAQGSASLSADRQLSGARSHDVLAAQVLLDRSRHSPGVIDAMMGGNTRRAIEAFQRASGIPVDGRLTAALLDRLRAAHPGDLLQRYTITAEDVAGPFVDVPEGMAEQARLATLAYESPGEAIAEKFHMAQSFLEALNPGADFGRPGSAITVVVAGNDELDEKIARIEVDKAASALRAFAADGSLVATYPATVGSSTFPSPNGAMEVLAVAPAPTYHFDPEGRDWGPDENLTIAAGPNNPVGGTWIDLSKEGYGIHGSPDPALIGQTSSHGCVRLTNWDAAELAKAVDKGTAVEFV